MRASRPSAWSAAIVALAIASLADARPATVKGQAHLRAGPSATTELLGDVDAGAVVDIIADSGGWRQVKTGDGRAGYLWSEHLIETEAAPGTTPPPRTIVDDGRSLHDDADALRERPPAATGADVERLRAEIERLTAAQQVLARRLDERFLPAADPPPGDPGGGGLGLVMFLLGGGFGWTVSRLFQGRRDRREQKIRF